MRISSLLPAVLAGLSIILLAAVLVLGGGTVLYEAADDAFSPAQKDPSAVSVMTTEESETILPLMTEIMLQSAKVALEIESGDFEFSERELQEYANLVNRLKTNNAKIKLGNTEINDFRLSSDELRIALEILESDSERLEEIKQEIRKNSGDVNALASLYAEVQALSREMELAADTYAENVEGMIAVAQNHNLDTSKLKESVDTVNKLVSSSLSSSSTGSLRPGSSSNVAILFTLSDEMFVYGDTLVIEGSSRLSGTHAVYLDSKVWGTVTLKEPGTFTKSFKITNVSKGVHSVSIRAEGGSSKLASISVVTTPTEVFISSVKVNGNTVTILGGLQTVNGIFVSDAVVDVYADGIGLLGTNVTNKNGVFTVQTELADGEYLVYAEFSDFSFPLEGSVSEPVTVKVADSYLFLILGAAVLGIGAVVAVRLIRKRRSEPVAGLSQLEVETLAVSHPSPAKKVVKAVSRVISSPIKKEDSDKLRKLYHETVRILAVYERIEMIEGKTPREILSEIKHQNDDICIFITEYEYLHYADVAVSETDLEKMQVIAAGILEKYHEDKK